MRGIRWVVVAGALLIGLAAAGAWLLPSWLDWNRYRGELASLASDTLGRRVRIAGPVSLILLPQPMLTASGVTIDQGGSDSSITAAQLRLRVALGALFLGHVDAQELVLRGADIHIPWPLAPGALALHAPAWLSSLSARIEDGRLTLGSVALTGIDASLTTAQGSGSTMATGTGHLAGYPWRFTMRLSRPGGDGAAGLDVTLDGQDRMQGVGAALSAQIGADGTLSGRIDGRGPELSRLLPAPAIAFRAAGRISYARGLLLADRLDVDLGGSPARGAVALRVTAEPRLDIALAATRLDLDAWLTALMVHGASGVAADLPTSIDLSADAAPLAGGTLRTLRGAFDLAHGAITVRELSAVLPGDASLRSTGQLTLADPASRPPRPPQYDGHVSLDAPALRTTLAWLHAAGLPFIDQLPADVLRTGRLGGHAVIIPGRIALDQLAGRIDGATVGGSLTVDLGGPTAAQRPHIGAGLSLDRLDLDPWLSPALEHFRPGDALPPWLRGLDIDLRLDARQASLHGLSVAPLLLDASAEAGHIILRKLDATAQGVHLTASGTLGDAGRIAEARLDVQAPRAALLAALLPAGAAPPPRVTRLLGSPADLLLTASGPPTELALALTGTLGDLRLDARPTLDLHGGDWAGPITLRHPGATRLAASLGVLDPAWLGDGSLSLVAQMARSHGRITADDFEITAGSLRATGALALRDTPQGPSLTGRIDADTLPLPMPRPAEPLDFAGLRGWQASLRLSAGRVLLDQTDTLDKLSATLVLSDGLLSLEGLGARLGPGPEDGGLTAEASLDTGSSPPRLSLDASITGAPVTAPLGGTALDLLAGTLSGGVSLTASGYSPAGLLATLGGTARLHVEQGRLAGLDLGRAGDTLTAASLAAALAPGSMNFETIDATARLRDGAAELALAHVIAASGTIDATGTIDLPAEAVDLDLTVRPAVANPPAIGLRLIGPLTALRRTPELADFTRWQSLRPAPISRKPETPAASPRPSAPVNPPAIPAPPHRAAAPPEPPPPHR